MKKLLVLILVFGMASVANAALQISVGGNMNPEDSTIYLNVSDTIMLDVWSTVPIPTSSPELGENSYWVLTAQTSCGYIHGGVAVLAGGDPDWAFDGPYDDAIGAGITGLPAGENGVVGYIGNFGSNPIPADTAIFDEIIFHCESLNGPTVVSLWNAGDSGVITGEPWDTVVIHQIPEPATIVLLGLGGLLLRRRK